MAVKKKRGETKEMEAEKILVVDDNKEIVYSISELLKYEGYEILKAYDGMEALDIMERGRRAALKTIPGPSRSAAGREEPLRQLR